MTFHGALLTKSEQRLKDYQERIQTETGWMKDWIKILLKQEKNWKKRLLIWLNQEVTGRFDPQEEKSLKELHLNALELETEHQKHLENYDMSSMQTRD